MLLCNTAASTFFFSFFSSNAVSACRAAALSNTWAKCSWVAMSESAWVSLRWISSSRSRLTIAISRCASADLFKHLSWADCTCVYNKWVVWLHCIIGNHHSETLIAEDAQSKRNSNVRCHVCANCFNGNVEKVRYANQTCLQDGGRGGRRRTHRIGVSFHDWLPWMILRRRVRDLQILSN